MIIDKHLLDELSTQAKANPRLRQSYDLRTETTEKLVDSSTCRHVDSSQRMLNAVEPGTVIPIHRHRTTTETIVVLRGRVVQHYYDAQGRKIASYVLAPYPSNMVPEHVEGSEPIACAMCVPVGQWHALESLEEGSVILECKDGAYEPLTEEDILH